MILQHVKYGGERGDQIQEDLGAPHARPSHTQALSPSRKGRQAHWYECGGVGWSGVVGFY